MSNEKLINILYISVSILIGIGLCVFPLISDDIASLYPFKDYIAGTSGDWLAGVKEWYEYGGGRLTNFISINSALMPGWIVGIVSSFCIFLILNIGAIIGDFKNSLALNTIYIFLFVSIFPWVDQLYLRAFQINYIWSTALSLCVVYRFLHYNKSFSCLTLLLCIVLGFWHEGFSACVLSTLVMLTIFIQEYRNKYNFAYLASIIPGLLILGIVHIKSGAANYFNTRYSILYVFLIPIIAFVLLWVITFISTLSKTSQNRAKRLTLREKLTSPAFITLLCLSVFSGFLMIYIPTGPRTGSLGIIAAAIGSCSILRYTITTLDNNKSLASRLIYFPLGTLITIHLALVSYQCIKARVMNDYVLKEYSKNPTSTIYAPMTLSIKISPIYLRKPYYDWFAHYPTTKTFTNFYGTDDKPFMVAPSQLKDIDYNAAKKLGGTDTFYLYDDLLIGPQISETPCKVFLKILHSNKEFECLFYVVPLTDKPGLAWYYPNNSYINQKDICSKAQAVEILDFQW